MEGLGRIWSAGGIGSTLLAGRSARGGAESGVDVEDPLSELAESLRRLLPEAARPQFDAATVEVRDAVAASTLVPQALARWRTALVDGAGGADATRALWLRALGLPPVPGLDDGLTTALLAGSPRLAHGWEARAALGPLTVDAPLRAVLIGRPALVAGVITGGLSVSVGVAPVTVSGGLALDAYGHELTGVLSFDAGAVAAGAFARLSSEDGTTSFLTIIGARFTPGIQLGFGFELSTVGGTVGVNVAVDVADIRGALASGAAAEVFFPADPVAGARLLPRLRSFFPSRAGSSVVGPAGEVTWLQVAGRSFLRLSAVVLLELPRGRVVVVGRGAFGVVELVSLRVDVLGEIDVARGCTALDMAIVDGRVMGWLRVSGTAAMRTSVRDPVYSLVTVGGFYPGFRAEVPGLAPQRRIAMEPAFPVPLGLRFEGYVAATDGTFQFGGSLSTGFDAGILAVHGHLGVDAIFQLDPLHFHVDLHGGVTVEAFGEDFCGVDFHGTLDGPRPLVLAGRVEVSFLGMSRSWDKRVTLVGGDAPAASQVADLPTWVAGRVDAANVSAVEGADPLVEIGVPSRDTAGRAVVHPLGSVRWSQAVAPLDTPIHRVPGGHLPEEQRLILVNLPDGADLSPRELFSPASFLDADRDALLVLPAYERMPSGTVLRIDGRSGDPVPAADDYRELYPGDDEKDQHLPGGAWSLVTSALARCVLARGAPPVAAPAGVTLAVGPEVWSVRGSAGPPSTSRTDAVLTAARIRTAGRPAVAAASTEPTVRVDDVWQG